MCGIAGLATFSGPLDTSAAVAMSSALEHRGPDDQGIWHNDRIALCHRRLAVIDLSPAGHQPMVSANQRWILSYNGEIYNADEIRTDLDIDWRGASDTEVLVEAIAAWGVEGATQRLVGMFSYAAYDQQSSTLYLCRDRLGIKPLYYGMTGDRFFFASELGALRPMRSSLTLNTNAIASHLRHGYIPSPGSVYLEVAKLKPGHILTLELDTRTPSIRPYWRLEDAFNRHPAYDDDADLEADLHEKLKIAVQQRMVADVPLGGFLSGGYDSSLVCALMQSQSSRSIRTFTIGFDDPSYNEATHARRVADHLGTEHTELIVTETDLLNAIEALPRLCDEPFADSSILPTYLVSTLARQHVTVALSGDGGDELFWGYPRYFTARRLSRFVRRFPAPIARLLGKTFLNQHVQSATAGIRTRGLGKREGTLDQKLAAAGELLSTGHSKQFYEALISHWKNPGDVLQAGECLDSAYNIPDHWTQTLSDFSRMAAQDTLTYLPDDILTKVDRASMAVSLEARVPLLDHRVVELAATLPDHMKVQGEQGKQVLRNILARYVPTDITDRPKMGFGVPLDTWLRGPLKEWAWDHLRSNPASGLFSMHVLEDLMQDHQDGTANNAARLWNVLMVQVWLTANT